MDQDLQEKQHPTIYPLFMPHAGCPFQCVYCNQHAVTRVSARDDIPRSLERRIDDLAKQAMAADRIGELAFYGGTFGSLETPIQGVLLETASKWVVQGVFSGIRFSTRPDSVSRSLMERLAPYPVTTVELGVQSLSEEVLKRSRRGYGPAVVRSAVELLRERSWRVGLQLMAGLPGDSRQRFLFTVSETCILKPDLVRIYPTVVLGGTVLAKWYHGGSYRPLDLETALEWCADAYERFSRAGIPVARMGLHPDPQLRRPGIVIAGPLHPAFGYLVRVRWWRKKVDAFMKRQQKIGTGLKLEVPRRQISEMIGPGRQNIDYLKKRWRLLRVEVRADSELRLGTFRCEME